MKPAPACGSPGTSEATAGAVPPLGSGLTARGADAAELVSARTNEALNAATARSARTIVNARLTLGGAALLRDLPRAQATAMLTAGGASRTSGRTWRGWTSPVS